MKYNKFLVFFITVFILIFALWLNMITNQYKFLKKAESLEKKGNTIWAIDYYGYTITCFTPFSPFIKKAETNILNLGKKFATEKKYYKALFAYEILRSSYFQIRSFYQPKKKLIEKLNYKIAEIKVKILKNENRLKNEKKEYSRQLKILRHNDFPSNLGSLIMCFSFIAWIGSIVFMILKGFKKEKVNIKVVFYSFGVYILFFSIWIISLFLI